MVRLFFNIWKLATIKINEINCQKFGKDLDNFYQSGEISPSLVTLLIIEKGLRKLFFQVDELTLPNLKQNWNSQEVKFLNTNSFLGAK